MNRNRLFSRSTSSWPSVVFAESSSAVAVDCHPSKSREHWRALWYIVFIVRRALPSGHGNNLASRWSYHRCDQRFLRVSSQVASIIGIDQLRGSSGGGRLQAKEVGTQMTARVRLTCLWKYAARRTILCTQLYGSATIGGYGCHSVWQRKPIPGSSHHRC